MLNFDKGGSSVRSFVGWLVWEGGNMRKSTGSVITGIVCRCCLRPINTPIDFTTAENQF